MLFMGLSNAQRNTNNFDFFSFEPNQGQQNQQQRPQVQPRGRVPPVLSDQDSQDSFDPESKVKTTTPVPILQQINE